KVRRGSLDDLDTLRDAAAASDGVIHLAFRNDLAFSGDMEGAMTVDTSDRRPRVRPTRARASPSSGSTAPSSWR
ncbi:MAG: hypothetical protein ACRDZY_16505, partial [Acidimicrobiales bacterium]